MTVSGKWLVFGGTLSVGAGFLGGMMFGRRTAPANMVAFGRTFRVGSDIFVDSAALEYLKARADEQIVNGRWTGLRFTDRWMFLELFHEGQVFPGQQGRSTHSEARAWRPAVSVSRPRLQMTPLRAHTPGSREVRAPPRRRPLGRLARSRIDDHRSTTG
jgi:hypothetical protein